MLPGARFSTTPKWFNFTPSTGTINGAQSASITVTPSITGLTAGVYPGTIKLTFGDGSTQTVQLLLVISSTAGTAHARPAAAAPALKAVPTSKLLPVFTTIGTGFNAPAAWPTPIVIDVVDDCGNAFNTGSVIVSFTDGDPPSICCRRAMATGVEHGYPKTTQSDSPCVPMLKRYR